MNTEPNCQKIIINIDYINDKDIVNIYSQFKTKLFFPKFYNQNEKDLLFYLNNAKFITYNISKQLKRKDFTLTNHEYNLQNSKSSDEIIVVIICTEESILIVEEKDDKRIPEILNKTFSLKKKLQIRNSQQKLKNFVLFLNLKMILKTIISLNILFIQGFFILQFALKIQLFSHTNQQH